ncbi:glycoside hydrolase family 47 protein [Teratosphaeria destructans]|uniref:alpha-1,2-Mannosidase n=1 Tax=Teratosphaeria destructans TaxID=418781 RepID=A0A9W7W4V6_9PEZI|nr:glycoside hydrolase family 47 protein [Teratosphaeria destructans]
MTDDQVSALRGDTRDLFYHGYTNYMTHAFPEDELKPLSCQPQTRNRQDPADIGLNDVLGNYSVTLVDSLSTLAILASDADDRHARRALQDFQAGVRALVDLYGDGTAEGRCGTRACGFSLDSKVQVFETNIRGVGGLLSAHLFASGELPIRGYEPGWEKGTDGSRYIQWKGFRYDGQLLRLAHDLASRLLPAFSTTTGIPYPRVNLKYGIPFYRDAERGICRIDGTASDPREITETCAAGAGSLVLEFTTLSRLTGDMRFENLAKRAFWAVWERRTPIGLVGAGIDAETGQWTMPPLAGIGAGIDSFLEYAMKSHILLSGLPYNTSATQHAAYDDPDAFLRTWQQAHAAIKRHIYRSSNAERHPYYGQSDLLSGAHRYSWIDNLSAYYPGLLTLAGQLEEAAEAHLVFAALWTRYSALPERWHAHNGFIDPAFTHWAGRPEFIESTYYLYQATKDPWYLHVGEMALRDIRRRCWTKCGWTDLTDVISGEQRDRMESFFLGETAKYLYLLFTEDHPLNRGDAPIVFSTEGHPLVIPKAARALAVESSGRLNKTDGIEVGHVAACPAPLPPAPLFVSNVANRSDLFHAAALAQLHLVPVDPSRASPLLEASPAGPAISIEDVRSPTNYSFYPWTLPQSLIPPRGTSSPIRNALISTLSFPNLNPNPNSPEAEKGLIALGALQKVSDGILINSLSNIRLNMVQETKTLLLSDVDGVMIEIPDAGVHEYRIQAISNWALGKDEKVLLSSQALQGVSPADPHFTRMKDLEMVDLVLDIPHLPIIDAAAKEASDHQDDGDWEGIVEVPDNTTIDAIWDELQVMFSGLLSSQLPTPIPTPSLLKPTASSTPSPAKFSRFTIPAILPIGPGAAPLPAAMDLEPAPKAIGQLPFTSIYYLDSQLCSHRLPSDIAKKYTILIIQRGGCSFGEKLANIPPIVAGTEGVQLVIVISDAPSRREAEGPNQEGQLIRPLLDDVQRTPGGFERRHLIAMLMVDGGDGARERLEAVASAVGTYDRESGTIVEKTRPDAGATNQGTKRKGLSVKRRYWFESMGVPIGNLIVV